MIQVYCLRCGAALERVTLKIPGTICACGGTQFASEPPAIPLKPYALSDRDKRLLKALRIAPDG